MQQTAAGDPRSRPETGFGHVATLAFVAARTIPGFGFSVSLVGGTAIAHATRLVGGRRGAAAGVAAAIESVAILGPARMSGPGGQLVTAPLIGLLAARGRGRIARVAVCTLARATFNAVTTALFIWVLAGGVGNYTGAYEATVGRLPGAPDGQAAALLATLIGILLWSVGASLVQVLVYERASRRWLAAPSAGPAEGEPAEGPAEEATDTAESLHALRIPAAEPLRSRFDPRAVIGAAFVVFALLLSSTAPPLLAAVAVWLLIAWQLAPAEAEVVRPGLALAGTLALGAFLVTWLGGEGLGGGLEHAARGALLVLTATWMRGAAGTDGVREVARRTLRRLGRLRAAGELRTALDTLAGDRRMGAAIRTLLDDVRGAERGLLRRLDAAIDWVDAEARRFRPTPSPPSPELAYGPLDLLVLVGAMLPALTLAPG